jgi:hypothetical protein
LGSAEGTGGARGAAAPVTCSAALARLATRGVRASRRALLLALRSMGVSAAFTTLATGALLRSVSFHIAQGEPPSMPPDSAVCQVDQAMLHGPCSMAFQAAHHDWANAICFSSTMPANSFWSRALGTGPAGPCAPGGAPPPGEQQCPDRGLFVAPGRWRGEKRMPWESPPETSLARGRAAVHGRGECREWGLHGNAQAQRERAPCPP